MMNLITLFVFIFCRTAAYDKNCPVSLERSMRSKTVCADYRNYTCLFDETRHSFMESCIVKNDFQRPGYRVTLRTNINAKACEDDLYQPFIFYTNTSSDCELQRLFCSDIGQIVSSNGTIKTDRQCRCNYAQGFTYVTKPRNICSCKPSVEDCSCYRKKCLRNYILSPDYKCIDQFTWSGKFLCSSISDLRNPIIFSRNIIRIRREHEGFSRDIPVTALRVITLAVLSLIFPIIVILIHDIIPGIQLCSVDNLQRVFKRGYSSTDAQCAISQKNVEDSIITQANMEIPTEEGNNKTLKLIDLNTPLKTEPEDEASCLESGVYTMAKEKITSSNCMLLRGKPGCGKTTLLKFITLYLQNHCGYKTVICNKPSDIFKHTFEAEKRAFVFDDICGRFVFSYEKFLTWKRREKHILRLLQSENVKLIMSCSFVMFMNATVQQFSLFTDNAFELKAPTLLLRDLHTTAKDSQEPGEYLRLCDECAYLHDLPDYHISKVKQLRELNSSAFYSLLICILKSGCIEETVLTSDDPRLFTKLSSNVLNALNVDTSRGQFLDNLYVLMDIFISREKGSFSIKHTTVFEVLALFFGKELQQIFIKYADPEIITQHCCLETCPIAENDRFSILITKENEELYFQRIKELLLKGNVCEVFSARQMKLSIYQAKLAFFFKKLGKEVVKQISRSKCKSESETTFTIARRYDYNTLLQVFFECDDSINLENYPYLESACNTNNYSFVKLLIQRGININKNTSEGYTALHIAIKKGFLRLIFLLVANNVDVDCRDKQGNTPLIEACIKENETIISLLLENNANINKSNSEGETPLMIAAGKGTKRIVDLLIANQADINKVDFAGLSCLMHSIKSIPRNLEIVLTLLKADVDVSISSADGKTALIMAIEVEETDIVNMLTDYATDTSVMEHANSSRKKNKAIIINKCDNRRITPLIHACEFRNDKFDVVEYLLSKGAIINCSDEKDRTPLIVALENDDDDLVECLVKHGANVNFPGEKRTTPLHEMCKSGQFNYVSLLISKGSEIDIADRHSMTPLMLSSKGGYVDIAECLVQNKASVDSIDTNGTTALMLACIGGFDEIIQLLVENGADVNRRDMNDWTPLLSYANSSNDNPEIVRFLIEHGANKNETKKDGVSSLMMASFRGHLKIVEYLLKNSIDVNYADNYGKTAIFSACLSENMDIVSVLYDKGASTLISDHNGDTLMSLAKKNKLSKMIDFLTAFSEA